MIRRNSESAADVVRWMESDAAGLWPAFAGMRENCPACLSGEQHRSHVLYGRHNSRRFAADQFCRLGVNAAR